MAEILAKRWSTLSALAKSSAQDASRRLGYTKDEMTAHGFRATASSILHVDGNTVRRAYARAEFWDERVRIMQWWADRLDESNEGAAPSPSAGRLSALD